MSDKTRLINALAGVVPEHDVHQLFIDWAEGQVEDPRMRKLFMRMAERCGSSIAGRCCRRRRAACRTIEPGGFYHGDAPATSTRMQLYAEEAPKLALAAIAKLREQVALDGITHLVVASCTGFVAPGIDQIIARALGLDDVERTLVGFMGCYAAVCGAAHRLSYRPLRARGAGAGGDGRALLAPPPGDPAARIPARHAPVQRRRRGGPGHRRAGRASR